MALKVGIVVPYSWSFRGGVPEHADHQARSLFALGHEARVVIGHDPPGRLTKALHPRIGRHDQPPDYVLPVGRSVIVPANGTLPNIVLSPAALPRMRRIFADERFDVLHVHEPITPAIGVYALAAGPRPIVVTCHAAGGRLRWYPVGKAVWGVTANRVDYRIAVSERAAAAAEPYMGGPFEVIPNGVPLPREADPGGRSGNAVFIGRVDARKGLDVLLHAWPEVTRRTGARLRILGADPLSVRWLMRRHGVIGEGVDIVGAVTEEERSRELLEASLLVAPSIHGESFGLVLVEAFACATPVVASKIEGYDDVVEEGTGVLVPPGDPAALARAVIRLLEDETRRCALGVRAREVAEARYAWPKIVGRMVEIYEGLVGAPAGARAAAR